MLVGWNISCNFSICFSNLLWDFFKHYEILCISKQYFSSKPKGELTQPVSETTVPIFSSSLLQKDKYTTKCRISKISKLNNETFKEKKKRHSFQENTEVMYKQKCANFYDSANVCSKHSILKKGLVLYKILIFSSELWHIQYLPVSLKF